MNNVFRRPMFRKGGSAGEGITSGLAPRQGYSTAGDVQQNDISKIGQINRDLQLLDTLAPRPVRPPSTAMNDFLINFGLDLASRSPTGNIFQTAATSAKEPFAAFQKQISRMTGIKTYFHNIFTFVINANFPQPSSLRRRITRTPLKFKFFS